MTDSELLYELRTRVLVQLKHAAHAAQPYHVEKWYEALRALLAIQITFQNYGVVEGSPPSILSIAPISSASVADKK